MLFSLQKLDIRKSAFLSATAIPDVQRRIYSIILIREFISSQESCEENGGEESSTVLAVKPLPWRSGRINRFFKRLDERAKSKQKPSCQASQQTLQRVTGEPSSRSKPHGFPDDFWGFKDQ